MRSQISDVAWFLVSSLLVGRELNHTSVKPSVFLLVHFEFSFEIIHRFDMQVFSTIPFLTGFGKLF